jgi:hypothetical protein
VGYQLFPVYCTASQPCISAACDNAARLFTRRKQRRPGTGARNPRDLLFSKRKHELSKSMQFARRCLTRQKQRRREFVQEIRAIFTQHEENRLDPGARNPCGEFNPLCKVLCSAFTLRTICSYVVQYAYMVNSIYIICNFIYEIPSCCWL